ncbi:MAG: PAS domain S-box protein, partial [Gemmatimonadetes bacterium]|nr:PAS domain S-box protein [Gemmatimonadota bacterium]
MPVRPDTVLVTSYAVQALLAGSYGAAFWGFWRLYRQRYLRDWAFAWAVFALYAAAEGSAYWLAMVASESGERALFSILSITTGLVYAMLLLRGALGLAGRPRPSRRLIFWGIAASAAVALVIVTWTAPQSVSRTVRLTLRVGLVTGVVGACAVASGGLAWIAGRSQEWFGLRLTGAVLMLLGVREAIGGQLLIFISTARVLAPMLTVFDAIIVPVVGSAMAVSLIVTERGRARAAAAEAERAEAALRQSEARLRSIIEGTSDVIVTLNAHGVIEFAGPSVRRVLGWSVEEVTGHSAFDFVHPADVQPAAEAFARIRKGERSVPAVEIRLRAKDGTWRLVEALAQVRPAGDDDGPMIVLNARDLSERVELEARLLQAQKLESIGQLAGGVAHDFNNILTSILGHVSMARLGAPRDPQLHAELDDIQRSADRAAELTRQLLAFSRKQILKPERSDLSDLVASTGQLMRRTLGEHVI